MKADGMTQVLKTKILQMEETMKELRIQKIMAVIMTAALLLTGCSSNTAGGSSEPDTAEKKETAAVQTSSAEEDMAGEALTEGAAVSEPAETTAEQTKMEMAKVQFYNNCEGKTFTELYVNCFWGDGSGMTTENLLAGPAAEEAKGNADTYVLDYETYTPDFEVEVPGKTDVQISVVTEDGEKVTFEVSSNGCFIDPAAESSLITLFFAEDNTPVAETMNE
ncbi:hypothetical protein DXC97_04530 [Lachnospiraceae bacterium TF09-5]|nr:hypothetical protein DXC97_04530 [Lachnospiraceae bacterium TF09-5]